MSAVVKKPAEKGGNVVIWPIKMSEKKALRQLRDTNCYKCLTFNPLVRFKEQLNDLLRRGVERGQVKQFDFFAG